MKKIISSTLVFTALTFSINSAANEPLDCNSTAYLKAYQENFVETIVRTFGNEGAFDNLQKIDKNMRKGKFKKSLKAIDNAFALPNLKPDFIAQLHSIKGEAYIKLGKLELAISEYQKANEIVENPWYKKKYARNIEQLKTGGILTPQRAVKWTKRSTPRPQLELDNSGYCQLTYKLGKHGKTKDVVAEYCTEGLNAKPFVDAVSSWEHETSQETLNKIDENLFFTKLSNSLQDHCNNPI